MCSVCLRGPNTPFRLCSPSDFQKQSDSAPDRNAHVKYASLLHTRRVVEASIAATYALYVACVYHSARELELTLLRQPVGSSLRPLCTAEGFRTPARGNAHTTFVVYLSAYIKSSYGAPTSTQPLVPVLIKSTSLLHPRGHPRSHLRQLRPQPMQGQPRPSQNRCNIPQAAENRPSESGAPFFSSVLALIHCIGRHKHP